MTVCLLHWKKVIDQRSKLRMETTYKYLALERLKFKHYQESSIFCMFYFFPKVNKSLLSVGQLLKSNFVLIFKNLSCTIYDYLGKELFVVPMKNKCFPLDWNEMEYSNYASVAGDSKL